MTAITLGRGSPHRLDATYPHTTRGPRGEQRSELRCSACAYLVLLRVEIARFTSGAKRPRWLRRAGMIARHRLACASRADLRQRTAEHP